MQSFIEKIIPTDKHKYVVVPLNIKKAADSDHTRPDDDKKHLSNPMLEMQPVLPSHERKLELPPILENKSPERKDHEEKKQNSGEKSIPVLENENHVIVTPCKKGKVNLSLKSIITPKEMSSQVFYNGMLSKSSTNRSFHDRWVRGSQVKEKKLVDLPEEQLSQSVLISSPVPPRKNHH